MPELSATPERAAKNHIPAHWTISRHVFQCLSCMAWIAAGVRIARVNRRWVCAGCADRSEES